MSILGHVGKIIRERLDYLENFKAEDGTKTEYKDFLSRFLEIQDANPDVPPM